MNLATRISRLEANIHGDIDGQRLPRGFTLTAAEHAAFGLSRFKLLQSYDAEWAEKAGRFMGLYAKSSPPRQTDPNEMMKAMANTVSGDATSIEADRERNRGLMAAAFDRCGFDSIAAGA